MHTTPHDFITHPPPWGDQNPLFPVEWLGSWLRESYGRRRLDAVAELQSLLRPFGVRGAALVAGPWLAASTKRPDVWRRGPWPRGAPRAHQLWAEGAGDVSEGWLWPLIEAFLEAPSRRQPGAAPSVYQEATLGAVVVDPSLAGNRTALIALSLEDGSGLEALLAAPTAWWAVLGVAGLLRGEAFRNHWDQLSQVLAQPAGPSADEPWPIPWKQSDEPERPVNAQEVVHHVAAYASRYAEYAAEAFGVAAVCVFIPDPDDEYVYCLGGAGSTPHAYDSGLRRSKPRVPGVGFGLTASYAVGAAYEPSGNPVVVRALEDRAALRTRYLDLGFDEDLLDAPGEDGPFLGERFLHPEQVASAHEGPWVFTAQPLPRALSPSGRNLVVRFQGRTLAPWWCAPEERRRTSRDRRRRMASLALRVHSELVQRFSEGLARWRQGIRQEVLRELTGARRWPGLCQSLASWLSARAVSLFLLEDGELRLQAWSLPKEPGELRFEIERDLLDARELRLLQAPLYPRREAISEEGFLGWPELVDALGGPTENSGTVPILAAGRPVGVLRVDSAMSLFGGLLPRRGAQGGLHHHRPTVLPHHLRPVLEEVVQLLAASLSRPAEERAEVDPWADWAAWVRRADRGELDPDAIRRRLDALRAAAPTRAAAAERLGVHRNTLRRHLGALEDALGERIDF